jgi:putative ATP-dependent endonuclease of the OLD family
MFISTLKITNFRCLGPSPVTIRLQDLTAFVGNNGCGKSSILLALVRLFGTTQAERTLVKSDFHLPKGKSPDEIDSATLEIEAQLDFPELKPGEASKGAAASFKHMTVQEKGHAPYLRIRLVGTWKKSSLPEGELDQSLVWVTSAEGVEPEQTVAVKSERSRIHVHYIPAVRDPLRHIKQVSGSVLYQLLEAVKWSEEVRDQVIESSEALDAAFESEGGVQEIQSAIKNAWAELHSSSHYQTVSVRPVAKRFEDLLKQVEATFSPGPSENEEGVDRLSEGQKSLFYLALIASVFDIQDGLRKKELKYLSTDKLETPVLNVFAVEEPENHVAPHYLGRIMATLRRMSGSVYGQVALSSHSPAILARIQPDEVRHLRLATDRTTQVREIQLPLETDESYKFIREAVRAYPELYFARFVVLGEGDSEEIVLPRLSSASALPVDPSFVSIVPLAGRHVNHFWRLLAHLDIPYVTLLDLDRERYGGGWGRIKYALTQLLEIGLPEMAVLTRETNGEKKKISLEQLSTMHERDVTKVDLQDAWIEHLEKFGVFFSNPLDLDFMMLRAFPDPYEETVGDDGYGPSIPDDAAEYHDALKAVVKSVLKEKGGGAATYSEAEQEAFFWYRYLFLGRSKPSTHILALSKLTEKELVEGAPAVLSRVVERMKKALAQLDDSLNAN